MVEGPPAQRKKGWIVGLVVAAVILVLVLVPGRVVMQGNNLGTTEGTISDGEITAVTRLIITVDAADVEVSIKVLDTLPSDVVARYSNKIGGPQFSTDADNAEEWKVTRSGQDHHLKFEIDQGFYLYSHELVVEVNSMVRVVTDVLATNGGVTLTSMDSDAVIEIIRLESINSHVEVHVQRGEVAGVQDIASTNGGVEVTYEQVRVNSSGMDLGSINGGVTLTFRELDLVRSMQMSASSVNGGVTLFWSQGTLDQDHQMLVSTENGISSIEANFGSAGLRIMEEQMGGQVLHNSPAGVGNGTLLMVVSGSHDLNVR